MAKYTLTQSLSTPGKTVSLPSTQEAAAELKIDAEPLAGNASNAVFDVAFIHTQAKSIWLSCTQPCTIKTNSSGAPGNTIQLAANKPITWDLSSPYANPFTVAVTKFYVTNDSSPDAAGALSVFVLYDPTV